MIPGGSGTEGCPSLSVPWLLGDQGSKCEGPIEAGVGRGPFSGPFAHGSHAIPRDWLVLGGASEAPDVKAPDVSRIEDTVSAASGLTEHMLWTRSLGGKDVPPSHSGSHGPQAISLPLAP